jgi:hypothetical protein
MAILAPVASRVSGVGVVVDTLDEFEEADAVSAATGELLAGVGIVGTPLCVARTVLSQVVVRAGDSWVPPPADVDCAGDRAIVHRPIVPFDQSASLTQE